MGRNFGNRCKKNGNIDFWRFQMAVPSKSAMGTGLRFTGMTDLGISHGCYHRHGHILSDLCDLVANDIVRFFVGS